MWCILNTKRHKHADLIHAWAEGDTIQTKAPLGTWVDTDMNYAGAWRFPELRIKPDQVHNKNNTIRYRLAWMTNSGCDTGYFRVAQTTLDMYTLEGEVDFMYWATDWRFQA